MPLEAIKQVTAAEQINQERKAQAVAEAKRTIAEAERSGKALLEEARRAAQEQARTFLKEAEDTAAQNTKQVMEEMERTRNALRDKAEGRLAEAATLIARRVVNY